jgi:hypothetical protein
MLLFRLYLIPGAYQQIAPTAGMVTIACEAR